VLARQRMLVQKSCLTISVHDALNHY